MRSVFLMLRFILRKLARISPKFSATIELDMKQSQGKGYGTSSVYLEAQLALTALSNLGIANPIILDIGANIGTYSQAVLKLCPGAKIYAFEPSSVARLQLQQRFISNPQVKIYPYAVSDAVGTSILWSDIAGSGLGSLSRRKLEHFGITFDHQEDIQLMTLDDWNLEVGIQPDFVKIDVKGHELKVLNGARLLLKSVKVVQFEFGGCNIDTRTYFQDFWYFFSQANFKIFRIGPSGLIEILTYSENDECFLTTNYLAIRN